MEQQSENYYAVILAGGGGTRLWPKSRRKSPKHLLDLFGKGTLIKLTYDRIIPIIPNDRIFVITHKDQVDEVRAQLPDIPGSNIIAEPVAKNTALAMGVAAAFIHKKNPDASLIYLAADHIYKNVERFQQNILAALKVASSGDYIVSLGIKPTYAHTGLGYIKIGDELDKLSKAAKKGFVFKVKEFKEKPNLVTAQSFVASGQYLWNANLYCWSTNTIFQAFEDLSPVIGEAVQKILEGIGEGKDNELLGKVYGSLTNPNSIDYEISEKAKNIVVIPGDFGWSDIGDWKVVYDTHQKDISGNVIIDKEADYIGIDTKNSLIEANGKLIVTIGLEDLIIVDTEDALLICKKDKAQDVKKAVEKLKEEGKDKYL